MLLLVNGKLTDESELDFFSFSKGDIIREERESTSFMSDKLYLFRLWSELLNLFGNRRTLILY